jgi:hypothetical protein
MPADRDSLETRSPHIKNAGRPDGDQLKAAITAHQPLSGTALTCKHDINAITYCLHRTGLAGRPVKVGGLVAL